MTFTQMTSRYTIKKKSSDPSNLEIFKYYPTNISMRGMSQHLLANKTHQTQVKLTSLQASTNNIIVMILDVCKCQTNCFVVML